MGENLPFSIWRADNHNAWAPNANTPPARKRLSDYFRQNFYVTISGYHFKPAFDCALSVMGPDRILFSTDWPFENVDHAANWFDTLDLPESDRQKIGRLNAMKLFGLDLG